MHKSLSHILITSLIILFFQKSKAQYTEVINSNRPSRSMGAFSVGKNVYQWEQGISFRQGNFDTFYGAGYTGLGSRTQLRVGLLKEQLEFLGTMDVQMDELLFENALGNQQLKRKGLRDFSAGAKYLVFDPFRNTEKYKPNLYSYHANNRIRWRDLIPAVSVYAGAQFATGGIYPYQEYFYPLHNFFYRPITEPTVSVTGMLILQHHLKPGLVLVHNAGMRYLTADIQQKQLIGTLTYSTRAKWSFYGEYQWDDSPLHRDLTLGTGAAYLLQNDLQVDLAFQHSLKTTPKLFSLGLGLSYRIDRHNKWAGQPQSIEEIKKARKERKTAKKERKTARKADKRLNKGLRKLDKKQKKIDRKLKKI